MKNVQEPTKIVTKYVSKAFDKVVHIFKIKGTHTTQISNIFLSPNYCLHFFMKGHLDSKFKKTQNQDSTADMENHKNR